MAEQLTQVLGIVGIKNMGEYNSQTNYEKLNVVTYQGSSYCALKDTVGNLPTNSLYWQLYAEKGDRGDKGETGDIGPEGPQGVPGSPSGGSPLAAASTSEMIDITKVYVNTTDGYWYYYDGDSWEIGGVYQASVDSTDVSNLKTITKDLSEVVFNLQPILTSITPLKFGHITTTGDIKSNNNKNICFANKIFAGAGSTIKVDGGYKYQAALYDKDTNQFIERISWKDSTQPYTYISDCLTIIEISDINETVLQDFSIIEHLHINLVQNGILSNFYESKAIDVNYPIGTVIDTTMSNNGMYRCLIVDCKQNDMFILNGKGGNNPRLWAFLDEDNKLLSLGDDTLIETLVSDLKILAPKNASKLIINDKRTNGSCYYLDDVTSNRNILNNNDENIKVVNVEINNLENSINNLENSINSLENLNNEQLENLIIGIGINNFKEKTLIVTEPNKYRCWPFIGLVNNKFVCLYSVGIEHEGMNFYVAYKTSKDGILWSNEKTLINTAGIRENICGKGNDSNGNLLVFLRKGYPGSGSTYDLYKTIDGENFTLFSSPTFAVPCGHIGDIIQIPNTTTLIAFFNTYGNTRSWGYIKSTDDGETWNQTVVESNLSPADCPTEMSGAYLGDNKFIVMGRKDAYSGTYAMFQLQSNDNGETWTKAYTNITDIALSTPSLIYNQGYLNLYYFQRGSGNLRLRINDVDSVWDNPTNWNSSSIISKGTTYGQDTGNVNACQGNDYQIATYYSGNPTDTGIYSVIM